GDVDGHLLAVAFLNELERVTLVDGAEDRAAEVGDAAHLVARQVDQADVRWFQQSVIAAADAGDLPAAPQPGERDGANDSVQAGSVAPAGIYKDVHALKAISWLHAERKRGVWKQSTPSPEIPLQC